MRQQSFRHRGGKTKSIGGGLLVVIAVGLGAFLVYHLILWFRSSNAQTVADKAAAVAATQIVPSIAPVLQSTAILKNTDGATVGTVSRLGTLEDPSYSAILNLPSLAPNTSYEVWLVKDGLADVKSVGMLAPRADGSWSLIFTAKDPIAYPTVVIMIEPNDGKTDPSGNRIAEGRFE